MKKQILLLVAIIVFLNAFAAKNVSAQSVRAGKVSVAFDFEAKGESFPAGDYYIEQLSPSTGAAVFSIRGGGRAVEATKVRKQIFIANQLHSSKIQQPKLVFERRGENYFLKAVFLDAGKWGFSLPVPPRKRDQNAADGGRTETVELRISKSPREGSAGN